GAIDSLSIGDYTLRPFDTVLFLGNDPVGKFIQTVELHDVVPRLQRPFHNLWTHAGMLINKSVLPLPFLEEGKMYLYESIFSGEVLGYVYSKVLPLDHKVQPGSFHLGPQIRDFEAVVKEVDSDVAICPLDHATRERIEQTLRESPNKFMEIYQKYHNFSYPLSIVPQLAAASPFLYNEVQSVKKLLTQHFPKSNDNKDAVFCSELVAIVYQQLLVPSFQGIDPGTHTPLSVQVVPEFQNRVYYAKENKVELLRHGRLVPTKDRATRKDDWFRNLIHHVNWVEVGPDGGVPTGAEPAGYDIDNIPLYVCRVRVGDAVHIGKVRGAGVSALHAPQPPQPPAGPATAAHPGPALVTFGGDEVTVHFGHEVLATYSGLVWETARDGKVPEKAMPAGLELDGRVMYVARARMHKRVAKTGVPVLGNLVGESRVSLCPGEVGEHMKGALVPFDGDDHTAKEYEVLCYV
ncbi:hypothetical protein HK405_014644, partial [Cladochytrium tenue]